MKQLYKLFTGRFFAFSCSLIISLLVGAVVLHAYARSATALATSNDMTGCARSLSATLIPCCLGVEYLKALNCRKS